MRSRPDDAGPNEPIFQPSPLVERLLGLLEGAGAPQGVCDEVVTAIERLEALNERLLEACSELRDNGMGGDWPASRAALWDIAIEKADAVIAEAKEGKP